MSISETVRDVFGLACPECGRDDNLRIVITTWATLSEDGTEPFGDHEWDDTASCRCHSCNFSGVASDFAHFDNEEAQS
jgi:hypothetical protein